MKRTLRIAALAVTASLCGAPAAHAVVITYDLASLGANQYRYDYTVTNDGTIAGNVSLFDILFDPSLYDESSLADLSDPALAWDRIFLWSVPSVPAAFDALALDGGLDVGESLSGFSVGFTWLGDGLPGGQDFEIYDPETFGLLGSGRTQAAPPVSVPEPEMFVLFGFGLLMLWLAQMTRIARKPLN